MLSVSPCPCIAPLFLAVSLPIVNAAHSPNLLWAAACFAPPGVRIPPSAQLHLCSSSPAVETQGLVGALELPPCLEGELRLVVATVSLTSGKLTIRSGATCLLGGITGRGPEVSGQLDIPWMAQPWNTWSRLWRQHRKWTLPGQQTMLKVRPNLLWEAKFESQSGQRQEREKTELLFQSTS